MILHDYKCTVCDHLELDHFWEKAVLVQHTIVCEKCGNKTAHIRYKPKPDFQRSLSLGKRVFGTKRAKRRWLEEHQAEEGGDLVGGSRHYVPPGMDEPAGVRSPWTQHFDEEPTEKDLDKLHEKVMERINQGSKEFHYKTVLQQEGLNQ